MNIHNISVFIFPQMLLMKQRAEITLQVFNESQIEMKDAVNRLQERYKRIISSMQVKISQPYLNLTVYSEFL